MKRPVTIEGIKKALLRDLGDLDHSECGHEVGHCVHSHAYLLLCKLIPVLDLKELNGSELRKAEQRVLDASDSQVNYMRDLDEEGNFCEDQWGESDIELVESVKALRALKKKIRKAAA